MIVFEDADVSIGTKIVEVTVEDEERSKHSVEDNVHQDEEDGADEDESDDIIEVVTEHDHQ